MTLPHDVSRCLDDECPAHLRCRRWLERDIAGERTPYTGSFAVADGCDEFIPVGSRQPVTVEFTP